MWTFLFIIWLGVVLMMGLYVAGMKTDGSHDDC